MLRGGKGKPAARTATPENATRPTG
jgi:hypothetical protein